MEKQLEELKSDVKEISKNIQEINITLAKQHVSLDHHMARTTANEKRIEKNEDFKWYFVGITVLVTGIVEFFKRLF